MNKNYTLKELADIGAKAAGDYQSSHHETGLVQMTDEGYAFGEDQPAREAFTKAVLDAVGYEFPKDEEREAFERWSRTHHIHDMEHSEAVFAAWKAGREDLRRRGWEQMVEKEPIAEIDLGKSIGRVYQAPFPQNKTKLPPPPVKGMKVCRWKDIPPMRASHIYNPHIYLLGKWMKGFTENGKNPSSDTIVAYWPEAEINEDYLTAEYKTEPAWIPWSGGECPLPDGVKRWQMKTRAGDIFDCFCRKAGRWSHEGTAGDILAYRVWEG